MFKNTYQSGLLSIFYSCGSNPLAIWDMEVRNGHVKRITDQEVNSIVLEIVSTNVATTFISCPRRNQVLGIRLPFLVMIVKNLKRYFSFEITILDDKNMRRRFRISNFQSTTKIRPFCTTMPIGLSGGWNQIQFNLSDFTRRAYGSQFIETLRVQVHANVRLRRIYFSDRLYTEEELPQDYKLYLPLERKMKKKDEKKEEAKVVPIKSETGPAEVPAPVEQGAVEATEGPPPSAAPSRARQSVIHKKSQAVVEAAPEGEAVASEGAPTEGTEEVPAEGGEVTPAEGGEGGEVEAPADAEAPAEGDVAEPAAPQEEGEAPPAPEGGTEAPPASEGGDETAAVETPAEAPAEEAPAEATEAAEAPAEE